MQMDWTTFVLEVVNFLVLVWLLQHFFYRPVLAVLDRRQAKTQAIRDEAAKLHRDAEALKAQYETRLSDWSAERGKARQQLEEELGQERTRRLDELRHALADEAAKSRARDDAAGTAREEALSRQAAEDAYGAAAAMLQRLASPHLTASIVRAFCEDLSALSSADATTLRQAAAALEKEERVEVASAHPLEETQRSMLTDAISAAAGQQLDASFREVPELIAGLRASVGQCRLDACLADELAFFRKQGSHA